MANVVKSCPYDARRADLERHLARERCVPSRAAKQAGAARCVRRPTRVASESARPPRHLLREHRIVRVSVDHPDPCTSPCTASPTASGRRSSARSASATVFANARSRRPIPRRRRHPERLLLRFRRRPRSCSGAPIAAARWAAAHDANLFQASTPRRGRCRELPSSSPGAVTVITPRRNVDHRSEFGRLSPPAFNCDSFRCRAARSGGGLRAPTRPR